MPYWLYWYQYHYHHQYQLYIPYNLYFLLYFDVGWYELLWLINPFLFIPECIFIGDISFSHLKDVNNDEMKCFLYDGSIFGVINKSESDE